MVTRSDNQHYAGRDRRHRHATTVQRPTGPAFTVVGAALIVGGLIVPLALARVISTNDVQVNFIVVRVLASLLLGAAGLMSLIRWRMTGEAVLAILGAAMILYATLGALPALLRLALPVGYVGLVRSVNGTVVLALIAAALMAPPVSSRLRPHWVLSAGFGVSLLAYLAIYHYAMSVADSAGDRLPVYLGVVLTGGWLSAGAAALVIGARRAQPRLSWLGLTLSTLAFAEAAQCAAAVHTNGWLLASGSLRLIAGGVWFFSSAHDLFAVLADQGQSVMSLSDRLNVATARLDAAEARDEERRHDARAALCAVQSAIATLNTYYERLEHDTRNGLERAVESELDRLRHLLDNTRPSDFVFFDLASAIEPVITAQRTQGMKIDLQLGSFCWVHGRPADTATVTQTLLENARRHAPGSPVTVRISRVGGAVTLAVEDRGPGVPAQEQAGIFERGVRGAAATDTPGSGLGLFIAQQLMRDQHGEIAVRDALDGGACFVVTFAPGSSLDLPAQQTVAATTRPALTHLRPA